MSLIIGLFGCVERRRLLDSSPLIEDGIGVENPLDLVGIDGNKGKEGRGQTESPLGCDGREDNEIVGNGVVLGSGGKAGRV